MPIYKFTMVDIPLVNIVTCFFALCYNLLFWRLETRQKIDLALVIPQCKEQKGPQIEADCKMSFQYSF